MNKLEPFKSKSLISFKKWIKKFEFAIDMAFATENSENLEYLKFSYLGEFLEETNKKRLKKFNILLDDINYHFESFVHNTTELTNIPRSVLLGKTEVDYTNDENLKIQSYERSIQRWAKVKFIDTLPKNIEKELEQFVDSLSLLDLKNVASSLISQEKSFHSETIDIEVFSNSSDRKICHDDLKETSLNTSATNLQNEAQCSSFSNLNITQKPTKFGLSLTPRNITTWFKFSIIIILCCSTILASDRIKDCNNKSLPIWKMPVPNLISCYKSELWHLEWRYVYHTSDAGCEGKLTLLGVNKHYVLRLRDFSNKILFKTPIIKEHCGETVRVLSQGYLTQLEDSIWTKNIIPDNVSDSPIKYPANMKPSIRGIGTQIILYTEKSTFFNVNASEWDEIFNIHFKSQYTNINKIDSFRIITIEKIQQWVKPVFVHFCHKFVDEYENVNTTTNLSKKSWFLTGLKLKSRIKNEILENIRKNFRLENTKNCIEFLDQIGKSLFIEKVVADNYGNYRREGIHTICRENEAMIGDSNQRFNDNQFTTPTKSPTKKKSRITEIEDEDFVTPQRTILDRGFRGLESKGTQCFANSKYVDSGAHESAAEFLLHMPSVFKMRFPNAIAMLTHTKE
uniref:Uncharacterized protein n=1 Tax=Strongyloides stercoralis TaxID=6248 RepID=A0A0K0EAX8_STRER